MTPENKRIPEWARQERQQDLDWIQENGDIFQLAATVAFGETGRGAIVVDATAQPLPDSGHPFGYFAQGTVQDDFDDDTKRMVGEYDPSQELVVVLLKPENKTSTYRIRAQPSTGQGGADHK
jgi:hypothetical protein